MLISFYGDFAAAAFGRSEEHDVHADVSLMEHRVCGTSAHGSPAFDQERAPETNKDWF